MKKLVILCLLFFFSCIKEESIETEKVEAISNNWKVNYISEVVFSSAKSFDPSQRPTIAMNAKGQIISVHQSNGILNKLYYNNGILNSNNENIFWGSSHGYDSGQWPIVAMNDNGVVVEIHETSNVMNDFIWYHVGIWNENKMEFGSSHKLYKDDLYSQGAKPSITINNNNQVIVIYESYGSTPVSIHYNIGTVNLATKEIDWVQGKGIEAISNQTHNPHFPKVTMNNSGDVLLVWYKNENNEEKTYYITGKQNGLSLVWNQAKVYGNGSYPNTTLNDDGSVIEIHNVGNAICFTNGYLEKNELILNNSWKKLTDINGNTGKVPSVTSNSQNALAVFSNGNSNCAIGTFIE
ncbi:hypothetical protein [Aureivirga marina]|uniref:hypothetical protein n=1 Tax=Aureivirga marina TaxID=1182451 RepID=UPI0018C9D1DE|nr:hypothetical protein [Aureivirga marina]